MAKETSNIDDNLKKSFLNVYQTLQFSKVNKSVAEVADIERRCLFTKYMICKNKYVSEYSLDFHSFCAFFIFTEYFLQY